jgi:translation initiation factor IF-1
VVGSTVEMDGEVLHGLPSWAERPMKFKVRLESGTETIAFTRGRRLFRRKLSSGDGVRVRLDPENPSRGVIVRRHP